MSGLKCAAGRQRRLSFQSCRKARFQLKWLEATCYGPFERRASVAAGIHVRTNNDDGAFIDGHRAARTRERLLAHVTVGQDAAVQQAARLIDHLPPVRILFASQIRAADFYGKLIGAGITTHGHGQHVRYGLIN